MRIVKSILFAILGIIALVLIIALFVTKEYVVKRDIDINKPKQEVFNYVKLVRNQDHYNKWTMADPNMKKDFSGTDGTEGFVYAWNGNNEVGQGDQTITKLNEGESVVLALHFIKPFEGRAVTAMQLTSLAENRTKVTWDMHGKSNYPMNFMNLFINGILGKDLEKSLANLKHNIEQQ